MKQSLFHSRGATHRSPPDMRERRGLRETARSGVYHRLASEANGFDRKASVDLWEGNCRDRTKGWPRASGTSPPARQNNSPAGHSDPPGWEQTCKLGCPRRAYSTFAIVSFNTSPDFCNAIFSRGQSSTSMVPMTPLRPTTVGTEIATSRRP